MADESLLSDQLLHDLIAVGQVDVLVGVPTLNNASTIEGVVRAVHHAFARYFPRDRTVLINSDGGSEDGTPALIRSSSIDDAGTLMASHSLRTVHRISTPYHGLPGKGNALRQIFAAADLTQAKAVAVLDPDVTSVTPEWIAALVNPIKLHGFDFASPVYAREPTDGLLVTQIVRPVVRAAYGWQLTEPLAGEFGCSGTLVSQCLDRDVWDSDLARYGIDLWVTATALSGGFRCCQAPLGPRVQAAKATRPGFQDIFQQVMGALFGCLEADAAYWTTRQGSEALPVIGSPVGTAAATPTADGRRLARAFCEDLRSLRAILEPILSPETLAALSAIGAPDCEQVCYPDDLWAATVYEFLAAYHRGVMRRDHIMQALAPLYLGRSGSFLVQHEGRSAADVESALDALCATFERSKPLLVERWSQTRVRA